jgi:hypothetical protein
MTVNNIKIHWLCVWRWYNEMYWVLLYTRTIEEVGNPIKVQNLHAWTITRNPFKQWIYILRNEGQKCTIGSVWGWVPVWGVGAMERVKESEYGRCTLYTCMKIELWNLWNYFKMTRRGMRENDGVSLTKVHCKHIWKCHNEILLYSEYMLIKMFF